MQREKEESDPVSSVSTKDLSAWLDLRPQHIATIHRKSKRRRSGGARDGPPVAQSEALLSFGMTVAQRNPVDGQGDEVVVAAARDSRTLPIP